MSWSPDGQLLAFMENIPLQDTTLGAAAERPQAQPFSERRSMKACRGFPRWPLADLMFDDSDAMKSTCSLIRGRRKVANLDGRWYGATWNPNGSECSIPQRQQDGRGDTTRPSFKLQQAPVLFEGRYERSPARLPTNEMSHRTASAS